MMSVCVCVCMCVALGIQYAMRMRHVRHLRPARLYNIFPHYLIKGMIFEKKKVTGQKNVCFDFLYKFCLKYFSF